MPHPSPSNNKMTEKQAESLEAMRSFLLCPLCNKRLVEPSTLLACAHSFCQGCILKYTENSWHCPLPGCRTPVTMKGGGNEYIKKNPLITAVASSLENIEQIIATGPENWWAGQNYQERENNTVQFEAEEEVVDFQQMMTDQNKGIKHKGSDSEDDASSTTKDFIMDESMKDNYNATSLQEQSGPNRKTMSIDQSLFPSEDGRSGSAAQFNQKRTAPPDFPCSPIAMQSSQPELSDPPPMLLAHDGKHGNNFTATANQVDSMPTSSSKKRHDMLSPTLKSSAKVKPNEVSRQQPASSRKKQRVSISTPPVDPSLAKEKDPSAQSEPRRRTSRVSFQQQPRVMLLNPSWTLSNEHTRCLRKCVNDGFIAMLKTTCSNDSSFDDADQFDSGFDFDTEDGRESFLAMLSSDRNDNCPPAPMSFYAISTEKDTNFSFGDAIIVPRSFPYYLSLACGLPIVDIEFLSSAANLKRRGTMNHQRYPFPSLLGDNDKTRKKKKQHSQNECLVLGASNYTWDAPKKSRAAAIERHSMWQKEEGPHAQLETLLPGTDLFWGYSVLLLGEFDQPNHSKRTVAKRKKRRDSESKGGGYCTRGNISLLLQLCGAKVYDIDSVTTAKQIKKGMTKNQLTNIKNAIPLGTPEVGPTLNDTLLQGISPCLVMVKDKSEAKLGHDLLAQLKFSASLDVDKLLQISVVSCQWLLDSIGEFEAQEISTD